VLYSKPIFGIEIAIILYRL